MPSRGVFNWSITDGFVAAAKTHGVDHSAIPGWLPQWAMDPAYGTGVCQKKTYCGGFTACRRMPLLSDWDAYITARVQRYKSTGIQAGCTAANPLCHGVMQYWELWNEPDTIYTDISVANIVILTTRAYNIVRSIDPKALILAPSGGAAYMDKYWAAGGERGIDIITFHSYHPVPERIQADISAMRAIMAKYGLSAKPLWNTEGSWDPYDPITADDQAGYPARSYLLQWSLGIQRFYWYQWGNANWGTINDSNAMRPAGIAYEQTYNWMVGATMSQPCAASGTIWSCGLMRPGYQALAVWKTDAPASYAAALQFTHYRDLTGARFPIINHQVTVGPKPILLETAAVATNLDGVSTSSAGLIGAVVNGASYIPGPAPGSVSTILGTNLAAAESYAAAVPLPTSLGGVGVTINGTAAPLWYVGPQQINFEMPAEVEPGPAIAIVTIDGAATWPFSFTVAQAAPGIFGYGNNRAVATNGNGSLTDAGHPATPGNVITVYLTGLGPLDHSVPTNTPSPAKPLSRAMMRASATIGKVNAPILFLGLTPGGIALAQANIRVPNLSPGDYPVVITIGVASNARLVAVGRQ